MPLRAIAADWDLEWIPVDRERSSEVLAPPGERYAGAQDRADAGIGRVDIPDEVSLRVASRPAVYQLKELISELPAEVAPTAALKIYRKHDIWVVVHGVAVEKRSGPARVLSFEYQGELCDESAATVDLFPSQRFETVATVVAEPEIEIGAEGEIGLSGPETSVSAKEVNWCRGRVKAKGGGTLKALLKLRLVRRKPVIEATGRRSSEWHWAFSENADQPLLGDHVLVQTIRVPKGSKSIRARAWIGAEVVDWYSLPRWASATPFIWSKPIEFELSPQ